MIRLTAYTCAFAIALVGRASADVCSESQSLLWRRVCAIVHEPAKGDSAERYCSLLRRLTTPSLDEETKCAVGLALVRLGRAGEVKNLHIEDVSACPPLDDVDWNKELSAEPNATLSVALNFPAGALDSLEVVDEQGRSRKVYCSSAKPYEAQEYRRNEDDFDSRHTEITVPDYGAYQLEASWKHGASTSTPVHFRVDGEHEDVLDYGILTLDVHPESAALLVDGQEESVEDARAGLVLRANRRHRIVVTAAGYRPDTKTVHIGTNSQTLRVSLRRETLLLLLSLRSELALRSGSGIAFGVGAPLSYTLAGPLQLQVRLAAKAASRAVLLGGGAGLQLALHPRVALGVAWELYGTHVWISEPTWTLAHHPMFEVQWQPFESPLRISLGLGYYWFPGEDVDRQGADFLTAELGVGWPIIP
jgi:hypothetical protein